MIVRIVCYENVDGWILGKIARRLTESLRDIGVHADVAATPDPSADVNHHVVYLDYDGRSNGIDTLMITHVDDSAKLRLLRRQLKTAKMGITMSAGTLALLADCGIPSCRLAFVNPAHDGTIKAQPLVLGISSKTHADGRKKENLLLEVARQLDPRDFQFKIMGSGWSGIVDEMRTLGITVEYHPEFVPSVYENFMLSLDYFIYFSTDEGSMAFLDAVAAGTKTIATAQGYHLDAQGGITHAIEDNSASLLRTLRQIATERRRRISSVETWTWENYAKQHANIWQTLIGAPGEADPYPVPERGDGSASIGRAIPFGIGRLRGLRGLRRPIYRRALIEETRSVLWHAVSPMLPDRLKFAVHRRFYPDK